MESERFLQQGEFMQRVSVGCRPPHAVSSRHKAKVPLRVIYGAVDRLPRQSHGLLGFLDFLLGPKPSKEVPVEEEETEQGLFDDVPDTGVRHVLVPRGLAKCEAVPEPTLDGIDEILGLNQPVAREDDVELPENLFFVEGIRLKRVTSHALGQFMRAHLKGKGRLGSYIDQKLQVGMSRLMRQSLDAAAWKYYRRAERGRLADELLGLLRREARRMRDNQERVSAGHTILHVPRGPKNSFFVFLDERTGVILRFYSAQGYNRRKAHRKAIWRNTRRRPK